MDDFVSPEIRGKWLRWLLIATVVIACISIISDLMQLELLSRIAIGDMSDGEADANDRRQAFISIVNLLISIATMVVFLMWFHRAHKNLPALGNHALKYSPRWAVGGFFVPVLALFRPLQVMREVWHGSDPEGVALQTAPLGRTVEPGTPALVGWWWGAFLVSAFLGRMILRQSFSSDSLEEFQVLTVNGVIASILDIFSAWLAVRLVNRVSTWQEERADVIKQGAIAPQLAATESFQIAMSE